jgi:hypothetical protein
MSQGMENRDEKEVVIRELMVWKRKRMSRQVIPSSLHVSGEWRCVGEGGH